MPREVLQMSIIQIGNVTLFLMGWTLFVAGQAQNSIRSTSNGLPPGFAGLKQWLDFHWLDLAHRAFWSGLFYGLIVHKATATMQAVGFPVTSYMVAGFGGWSANGIVYQLLGVLGVRIEMGEKVPPANAQIVPQLTANGPNSIPEEKKP